MEFLSTLLDALEPGALGLFAFLGPLTGFVVPLVFQLARQLIKERKRDKQRVDAGAEQQRKTELRRDDELDEEARRIHEKNSNTFSTGGNLGLERWLRP